MRSPFKRRMLWTEQCGAVRVFVWHTHASFNAPRGNGQYIAFVEVLLLLYFARCSKGLPSCVPSFSYSYGMPYPSVVLQSSTTAGRWNPSPNSLITVEDFASFPRGIMMNLLNVRQCLHGVCLTHKKKAAANRQTFRRTLTSRWWPPTSPRTTWNTSELPGEASEVQARNFEQLYLCTFGLSIVSGATNAGKRLRRPIANSDSPVR